MKVANINIEKERFKSYLSTQVEYSQKYIYENLEYFKYNWDLSDLDLPTLYNKSLSSKISGRLWGGSKDSAKSMMLRFIDLNKEFVRSMFRNLFDEDKELVMRLNRFGFHCDQMLAEIQEKDKTADVHFHENGKMVAFYLCFNDPMNYTLFDYNAFKTTMQKLESRSIPEPFEVERYFKLSNGLCKLLSRDEELIHMHKQAIEPYIRNEAGQLLVHDFYLFCAGKL